MSAEQKPVDLFSKCFGCQREFKPGDERLRFSLDEWSAYEGLSQLGVDIDIGLCAECIESGDFKHSEIVGPKERSED